MYFNNILSDKGIEQAIGKGIIKLDNIKDEQIQPASLDVRIGSVKIWDPEAIAKTARETSDFYHEPSDKFAKKIEFRDGKAFDVPPMSHIEIRILENIKINQKEIFPYYDLRSSRGRMGFMNYTVPLLDRDDKGYYISLKNMNPNIIRLYCGQKFAQLFFSINNAKLLDEFEHGKLIRNKKDFNKVKNMINIEPKALFENIYLKFNVGKKLLKFKNIDTIDTNKKYSDKELYDEIILKNGYVQKVEETPIIASKEKVELSNKIGLQILHFFPTYQKPFMIKPNIENLLLDHRCLNAGWVDPGYKGNVTSHPLFFKFNRTIKKDSIMALALIYYFPKGTKRSYGDKELNSHYQNSAGSGFKS